MSGRGEVVVKGRKFKIQLTPTVVPPPNCEISSIKRELLIEILAELPTH